MEKDSNLMRIYNSIKDVNPTVFNNMVTKTKDAFHILSTNINSISEKLSLPDTWDDDISAEINGDIKLGIDTLIEFCQSPLEKIIPSTGELFKGLKSVIEEYSKKVDIYNEWDSNYTKLKKSLGSCPSDKTYTDIDGYERNTEKYNNWLSTKAKIDDIESNLSILNGEITNLQNTSSNYITQLKGLLSTIGTEASNQAINSSINFGPRDYKESAARFGYDDNYTAVGTAVYDINGNKMSETYQIVNNSSNKVEEKGYVTYNEDGTVNTEKSIKAPTDPTNMEEVNIAGDETGLAKYLFSRAGGSNGDPLCQIKSEEKDSETEYAYIKNEDGSKDFTSKGNYSEEFEDGTTKKGEVETEGSVVNGENVKQKSTDNFNITTSEGKDYTGTTVTDYGKRGTYKAETTLKDNSDEVVLTAQEELVANYKDRNTGIEAQVASQSVTVGNTTTTVRTKSYNGGDTSAEFTNQTVVDTKDNQVGSYTEDDMTYIYYRDENGTLMEKEVQEGINGPVEYKPVEVGETYATLKQTNSDGTVIETKINVESRLDMSKAITAYEDARLAAGWKADYAREGAFAIRDGDGSPVEVTDAFGNVTCTFELIYDENN